jgi:hypothetical protein
MTSKPGEHWTDDIGEKEFIRGTDELFEVFFEGVQDGSIPLEQAEEFFPKKEVQKDQ